MISWILEAASFDSIMILSLQNLAGILAALLPSYPSKFRAIGNVLTQISRLRYFTTSYGKTTAPLVNRSPEEFDKDHKGTYLTIHPLLESFAIDGE